MPRKILRDDQWHRIEHLLAGKASDPGVTAKDNRLFIEAVLWIARTGAPWRDLPERFGNWNTIYKNFDRWSKAGVWARVLEQVQAMAQQGGDIDWIASSTLRSCVSTSTELASRTTITKRWVAHEGA